MPTRGYQLRPLPEVSATTLTHRAAPQSRIRSVPNHLAPQVRSGLAPDPVAWHSPAHDRFPRRPSRARARAANAYRDLLPRYEQCARKIEDLLTAWLDHEGVNYLAVSARAKSVASFRSKASRPSPEDSTAPRYPDPLTQITDLAAARVITYLPEAVERTCRIISNELTVVEDVDKGERTRQRGDYGYASRHMLVKLDRTRARSREYAMLAKQTFEIQVRTAAQHAWAEFEHDVRYKVAIPENRQPEINRRFILAAALLELTDAEFTAIDHLYHELAQDTVQETRTSRRRTKPQPGKDASLSAESPLDAAGLATWLAERYPQAPKSKREHYAWMVEILRACGVANLADLDRLLAPVDSEGVSRAMRHTFPPGHVRRLDDDLLAALGRSYVDQASAQVDRVELLERRLGKLRQARASAAT